MKQFFYIVIILSVFQSCDYFKSTEQEEAIARVNEVYLFKDDLKKALPENLSAEDSTIFANNFINQWATQQLLVQGAEVNLSDKKLEKFDRLVQQYKNDLYSKAYLEALVAKNLDTVVSFEAASTYYESNKEAFKLNENLIKFRYINVRF